MTIQQPGILPGAKSKPERERYAPDNRGKLPLFRGEVFFMEKGGFMDYTIFTSESVASGHPDKICDQISDSILDEAIKQDKKSRVAIETLVTTNQVVLAGEITTSAKIGYEKVARETINDLGYINKDFGFYYGSNVSICIHEQSPDISLGIDIGGAGDQGMMFGYAVNETPELMPLPITLAHRLVEEMDKARESKKMKYLRPDGKSEVSVYYKNGKPVEIKRIILAVPHDPKVSKEKLISDLDKYVIIPVLLKYGYEKPKEKFIVNGTGKWEIGGPASDTGVTGRKIIVDTYGGMGRHGGGCFSGKDPTKVDRSAAYAARFIAKNIVAHKLASRCEVQIAYVIGQKEPVAKAIETFKTESVDKVKIEKFAWNLLDLSVLGIINNLKLRQPIYKNTARYGHFGRNEFPWEKVVK